MTHLGHFKLSTEVQETSDQHMIEMNTLEQKFSEINSSVNATIKEGLLRRLSETNIEEENLDNVFENLEDKTTRQDNTNEELKGEGTEVKQEPKIEINYHTRGPWTGRAFKATLFPKVVSMQSSQIIPQKNLIIYL